MSIAWYYIPAQHNGALPEQWMARTRDRTVAVLRRRRLPDGVWEGGVWESVMQGPDGAIASLVVTNSVTSQAQIEVEHALHQMGWRS